MNTDPYQCIMVGSYYDEGWLENGDLQVGGDYPIEQYFHGYIRKIKLYDWAQHAISVRHRVRKEPYCHSFYSNFKF